jgi:hypothetical protein
MLSIGKGGNAATGACATGWLGWFEAQPESITAKNNIASFTAETSTHNKR